MYSHCYILQQGRPALHLRAWVTKDASICPLEVCVVLILLNLPAREPRREGGTRGIFPVFLLADSPHHIPSVEASKYLNLGP